MILAFALGFVSGFWMGILFQPLPPRRFLPPSNGQFPSSEDEKESEVHHYNSNGDLIHWSNR